MVGRRESVDALRVSEVELSGAAAWPGEALGHKDWVGVAALYGGRLVWPETVVTPGATERRAPEGSTLRTASARSESGAGTSELPVSRLEVHRLDLAVVRLDGVGAAFAARTNTPGTRWTEGRCRRSGLISKKERPPRVVRGESVFVA